MWYAHDIQFVFSSNFWSRVSSRNIAKTRVRLTFALHIHLNARLESEPRGEGITMTMERAHVVSTQLQFMRQVCKSLRDWWQVQVFRKTHFRNDHETLQWAGTALVHVLRLLGIEPFQIPIYHGYNTCTTALVYELSFSYAQPYNVTEIAIDYKTKYSVERCRILQTQTYLRPSTKVLGKMVRKAPQIFNANWF